MRFVFAFGWLPVLVLKSKPPKSFRGYTRILTWLVIPITWVQIDPDYWDDKHILIHELQHVEDYLRSPWLYWWRYRSREGRLMLEARAYARQLLSYPDELFSQTRLALFVLLATRYDLGISERVAAAALDREVLKLTRGY